MNSKNEEDQFYLFELGEEVSFSHVITESDVDAFANLTGDHNPLHMNEEYSLNTRFGGRVVHGMLSASLISTMIGMKIPGKGALWQSQSLNFLHPARIGDEILVKAVLKHKSEAQRVFILEIEIVNQEGIKLITGESSVKVLEPVKKKSKKMTKGNFQGVAIVTGGSRGIGSAIALKLASDGFDVALTYNKSKESAEKVASEIESLDRKVKIFKLDISSEIEIKNFVKNVLTHFSSIDLLVNNASSRIINKQFLDLEWNSVQGHIDTQVKGVFLLCQEVIPHFIEKRKGNVINIGSIYSDDTPPTNTYDYILAKTALSAMTKSLAVEFGPKGITFNTVSPGMTETGLISDIPDRVKMVTKMQTPLRRLGQPEDTANVVSFLASDLSGYITGETIRVCGGQRML